MGVTHRVVLPFVKMLLALCSVWTLSPEAWASAVPIFDIDQPYRSIRSMGMGGAMAAIADDYNTLFYNPAGLQRLKEGQINSYLRAGVSPNALDLAKAISDAGDDVAKIDAALNQYYGKNLYVQPLALGSIWVRPNWGMAIIPVDVDAIMNVTKGLGPTLNVKALNNTTLAMGYAREEKWLPGQFSVGGTAKIVMRGAIEKSIAAAELAVSNNPLAPEDFAVGWTADLDLGTLWSPDWKSDYGASHFSLVGRNLLDLGFRVVDEKQGIPPNLQRRFDLGTAWVFPTWSFFTPQAVLDIRDIGHSHWTPLKSLHTGLELKWEAWGWLQGGYRVGLNQGYLSAGISLQAAWFALDLATWGEETGTENLRNENRRYMVQLNLDI